MALSYPAKREFLFSLKSLEIRQGSELWKGLLSAKAMVKIDGRKTVYGTGPKPYGKTRGAQIVEFECAFESSSFFEWLKNHPNLLVEEIDITMALREGSRSVKIEILGLTFEESEIPVEGDEEVKVSLKGTANDIKIDGASMIDGDSLGLSGEANAA